MIIPILIALFLLLAVVFEIFYLHVAALIFGGTSVVLGIVSILNAFKNVLNEYNSTFKTFKIKAGKRYPNIFNMPILTPFVFIGDYKIQRIYKFSKESIFEFQEEDKYDFSKLFGFSFGLNGVHKESYRFGFRFINNRLQVVPYFYQNGLRIKENEYDILNLELDKQYILNINYLSTVGIVEFLISSLENNCENLIYKKDVIINKKSLFGMVLRLYLGGTKLFDRDVFINIRKDYKKTTKF